MTNKLILGDNLEVLKSLPSQSIDLCYIDPPFFSNRNYEVIWGDTGEIASFQDRWSGGINQYIFWLKERVYEIHRVLKDTGSFYLHCDWHADAYIRVDILDSIFGYNNFQDEIIWHYDIGNAPEMNFKKKHDVIFRYSKSKNFIFNMPILNSLNSKRYNKIEKETNRKYFVRGDSGKKCYLDEGVPADDVWTFIREEQFRTLNSMSKERIGYPTQKPEALLERIIRVSSNEGDTILDCFCGGGTTIAVANKLNRNWIGIDQSVQAIKVTELRLKRDSGLFEKPFEVKLHKYDYDELKNKDPFEFQNLVIEKYGGLPNVKKKGDLGIDGRMSDNTPIQVKKSENIGRNIIDNFKSAIERYDNKLFLKRIAENKIVGHIIAFSFGTGAIGEVARLKIKENILIELKRVDDILLIATKPKITLEYKELSKAEKELKEIEIKAEVEKKNEVEFYSWDFDYKEKDKFKAAVIRDIVGVQSMKLKAGEYNIAVKVVNKDGLESIEVIKLIVNGGVKQI